VGTTTETVIGTITTTTTTTTATVMRTGLRNNNMNPGENYARGPPSQMNSQSNQYNQPSNAQGMAQSFQTAPQVPVELKEKYNEVMKPHALESKSMNDAKFPYPRAAVYARSRHVMEQNARLEKVVRDKDDLIGDLAQQMGLKEPDEEDNDDSKIRGAAGDK
jgi:hypothetical protein